MEDIQSIKYQEAVPLTQWASIMIGVFIKVLTPPIILESLGVYRESRILLLYLLLDTFFNARLLNFRKLSIIIDTCNSSIALFLPA
jgi:hypothetical protein